MVRRRKLVDRDEVAGEGFSPFVIFVRKEEKNKLFLCNNTFPFFLSVSLLATL